MKVQNIFEPKSILCLYHWFGYHPLPWDFYHKRTMCCSYLFYAIAKYLMFWRVFCIIFLYIIILIIYWLSFHILPIFLPISSSSTFQLTFKLETSFFSVNLNTTWFYDFLFPLKKFQLFSTRYISNFMC
jgi:hypothetical protein